jgi:hypothetical protein
MKVVDDGSARGSGSSGDPVLGELVTVLFGDRLDVALDPICVRLERSVVPSVAAELDPFVEVLWQGTEGDQGVVGRAATEDLCAGVTDERVAVGLFDGVIVVVKLGAKEAEPLAKLQHMVEVLVRRAFWEG